MIIDRIERLAVYEPILPKIKQALAKVEELADWQEGERYPFDGGFVFFQKGETKPLAESQFESHQRFVDVQLVLSGSECLALADKANLKSLIPYNQERDVEKYDGPTEHWLTIGEGMGYVCFPWDAHKAVFHVNEPSQFTKAVIKLKL